MPNEVYESGEEEGGAAGLVRIVAVLVILLGAGFFALRSSSPASDPEPAPQVTTPTILPERQAPPPPPPEAEPATLAPGFVRPEPTGDLIAHWPLDGDGSDAVARTPWIEEGRPQHFRGPVGEATYFDHRTAYIINAADAPKLTNPFTIAAWVRLPWRRKGGDWPPLITAGDPGWRLHVDPFNRLPTLHLNDGGPDQVVRGSQPIIDGRWHHIAAVVDGRELRMYVDGQLSGRATRDTPYPIRPSRNDLIIGGHADKPQRRLNGALDDIRIYRAALSEDAIAKFADIEVKEPAIGRWYPVIDAIKPEKHTLTGRWRKVDGELEQFGTDYVNRFIRLPMTIRRSYELDLEFTRITGDNSVNLLLPVGGRGVHLMLGSHPGHGGFAGLAVVKGPAMVSAGHPTRRGNFLLEDGRCYGLNVQVRTQYGRAHIVIELDDVPSIDWEGLTTDLHDTGSKQTELPPQGILAVDCSRAVTRSHHIRPSLLG